MHVYTYVCACIYACMYELCMSLSNRQNRWCGVCLVYGVQPEVEKVRETVHKKVMWLGFPGAVRHPHIYVAFSDTLFLSNVEFCIDDTFSLKRSEHLSISSCQKRKHGRIYVIFPLLQKSYQVFPNNKNKCFILVFSVFYDVRLSENRISKPCTVE